MADAYISRDGSNNIEAVYGGPQFVDTGHAPTYVANNQFSVSGDLTSYYATNRSIRAYGHSDGAQTFNVTGKVSAQAHDPSTGLTTVTLDITSLTSDLDDVHRGHEIIDDADADYVAFAEEQASPGIRVGATSTTDATVTDLATVTLDDDATYLFTVKGLAKNTATNQSNDYYFVQKYYRHNGSAATASGSARDVVAAHEVYTAAGFALVTATNAVKLQWTGIASTAFTVDWSLSWQKI